MLIMERMDSNICKNCKHALLRCNFSLKQYGNYHLSYECVYNQSKEQFGAEFKRCDDSCDNFEKKGDQE